MIHPYEKDLDLFENLNYDFVQYETSFESWWKKIDLEFNTKEQFVETAIALNSSYVARVFSNSDNVAVGCQTIPIDRVRKVVEEYDNLKNIKFSKK